MTKGILALATGLLTVSSALPARADEKASDARKVCSQAYTQAQSLRDAHHLLGAREQLRLCSQSSCKEFIVKDCERWLVDVDARLPSVIFSVKDSGGQSLIQVSIAMDGTPLVTQLDGTAIDIDPGPHTFTFETSDGRRLQQQTLVLEGQKAQLVSATLPAVTPTPAPTPAPPPPAATWTPPAPSTPAPAAAVAAPAPAPSFWTPMREAGAVTAGVGVAGLVVGGVFGLMTSSAAHQQTVDCASATSCADHAKALSDHATAVSDGTIATVGVIAGAALAAGGVALFLLGQPDSGASPSKDATPLSIAPQLGPHVAGILLTQGF